MSEIEGYLIDRQGRPVTDCKVEIVAWEGDVLATSSGMSDHFTLRIPNVTPNTPVFFRITTTNEQLLETHHETDSPGLVMPASEQKIRLLLAAARNASDQINDDPARPAWVILPMPEKMVKT